MAARASSMQEKMCAICGKVKPISEFYKKSLGKYGVGSWCRECACRRQRGYLQPSRVTRVDASLAEHGFKACTCKVSVGEIEVSVTVPMVTFLNGDFSPETKHVISKVVYKELKRAMRFPPKEEEIYNSIAIW